MIPWYSDRSVRYDDLVTYSKSDGTSYEHRIAYCMTFNDNLSERRFEENAVSAITGYNELIDPCLAYVSTRYKTNCILCKPGSIRIFVSVAD